MSLNCIGLTKAYGDKVVLDGFTHAFPEGRVSCVLGRSGCGKTTLLRLIAGLESPDAGRVTGVPADGLSMVFQEDRLPPQLSAAGCLRCVLRKSADREARIAEALKALGIDPASDQPVREFSGGMRRRVALARALVVPAKLVLLDEPFKGLDADTRAAAVAFTRRMLAGRTAVLVTHDEADVTAFDAVALRMG